jgi:hypothetical protein
MRFNTPQLRLDWRFAVGQVLLTALGVALALAASAWWSSRVNREREVNDLHLALQAARTNERILRQAIYEDSISLDVAHSLREWQNHRLDLSDDSVVTLFAFVGWWSDAKPATGPFEMLVQTGDINLIRDPRLRAMLPSYLGEIDNRTQELRAIDNADIQRGSELASVPEYRKLKLDPTAGAIRGVRESRVAYAYVANEGYFLRNAVAIYRIMLHETAEMRLALEKYLDEKPVPLPQPRLLRDSF